MMKTPIQKEIVDELIHDLGIKALGHADLVLARPGHLVGRLLHEELRAGAPALGALLRRLVAFMHIAADRAHVFRHFVFSFFFHLSVVATEPIPGS